MSGSEAWSRDYWAKGFRLFAAGVDAHLLQAALRQSLGVMHDLDAARATAAKRKNKPDQR